MYPQPHSFLLSPSVIIVTKLWIEIWQTQKKNGSIYIYNYIKMVRKKHCYSFQTKVMNLFLRSWWTWMTFNLFVSGEVQKWPSRDLLSDFSFLHFPLKNVWNLNSRFKISDFRKQISSTIVVIINHIKFIINKQNVK